MKNSSLKFGDVTEKIIGCAMKVHTYFGQGFTEIVYRRSLMIELEKVGIKYASEAEREIFYNGQMISKRRLDLLVEEKVLIELKAVSEIDKSCYNQILNYLKVFGLEVGLLLNFGAESLQFKRLVF